MSLQGSADYIAHTVAVWPTMDAWNRKRLIAGHRRNVALKLTGWELDLRVLQALGIDPSLTPGFSARPAEEQLQLRDHRR